MTSYFYLEDPKSEFGTIPVPNEEMVRTILSISQKRGISITDEMILKEIYQKTRRKRVPLENKTYLYIDGTNLFAGLKELYSTNIPSFSLILKLINKYHPIDKIFFYASYLGPKKGMGSERKKLVIQEAKFYSKVKKVPNLLFFKGYRSPTSGKEKGVDVHLAVDLVKDAFLENYHRALIMTGDADLIYSIQIVQLVTKTPVYAFFLSNRFSLKIAYEVRSSIVLNFQEKFKKGSKKFPRTLKIVKVKK